MGPFATLGVYSFMMILGPFAAYYVTKDALEHWFKDMQPTTANISAAVVAVITVHVVLFAFVYKAYQEDKPPAEKQKSSLDDTSIPHDKSKSSRPHSE